MDYQCLCEIINNIIPVSKTITPDSKLASDLGLCSFDMMLLLFNIEERAGVQINISNLKKNMTVKELLNVIEQL